MIISFSETLTCSCSPRNFSIFFSAIWSVFESLIFAFCSWTSIWTLCSCSGPFCCVS